MELEGMAWYSSFIFLGLWCVVGYIILMVVRERKKRQEREEAKKEALRKALGEDGTDSVKDLERFFDKKGR